MKVLPENGTLLCIIHLSGPGMAAHSTQLDFPCYETSSTTSLGEEAFHSCLEQLTDLSYNVVLNLKKFHVTGRLLGKARGQNVTVFYFSRLGFILGTHHRKSLLIVAYPRTSVCKLIWKKKGHVINYYIPAKDFSGLAVIDQEHWRPQWACNWDAKDVYRRKSGKLITEMEGNISANGVEHLARVSSEESAKAFMKETIALGMKSRPKGLWGYYLYPDCHNYNFRDQNYSGSCSKSGVLRNNELSWLWDSSATLYPSIGTKKPLGNSQKHFAIFSV